MHRKVKIALATQTSFKTLPHSMWKSYSATSSDYALHEPAVVISNA